VRAGARRAAMSGYVEKVLGVLLEDEFALDMYITAGLTVLFLFGALTASLVGVQKNK